MQGKKSGLKNEISKNLNKLNMNSLNASINYE